VIFLGVDCVLETTSFRGDDDPLLVSAALACRACLSGDVDWTLELREWESQVACSCRACGHRRLVALNSQQALRLHLDEGQPVAA
jgi:hypothetical protein